MFVASAYLALPRHVPRRWIDPEVGESLTPLILPAERDGCAGIHPADPLMGGLADYADEPHRIAIETSADQLASILAPLSSDQVTIVTGFTERGSDGHLYNAAAVFGRGTVLRVYRKMHPAINRSVYRAGVDAPVFTVRNVTFGVLICRDSLFSEPARLMVGRGAQVLLVLTNNGMPAEKGGSELVVEARACDIARALESGVPVVRADVTGVDRNLVSYGSSGIVNRDGRVLGNGRSLAADLVVADIDIRDPPDDSGLTCAMAGVGQHVAERAV